MQGLDSVAERILSGNAPPLDGILNQGCRPLCVWRPPIREFQIVRYTSNICRTCCAAVQQPKSAKNGLGLLKVMIGVGQSHGC
jgi:hypothetical protein